MGQVPSVVGAIAEREVAFALERTGWTVYLPAFASHGRVDLVACRASEIVRVQVKTARRCGGTLEFRPCSHTGGVERDYVGEVDAFGVYSPELDRAYLVPIEGLPTRMCVLRLDPTRNGQEQGVRYAVDYEVLRRRC